MISDKKIVRTLIGGACPSCLGICSLDIWRCTGTGTIIGEYCYCGCGYFRVVCGGKYFVSDPDINKTSAHGGTGGGVSRFGDLNCLYCGAACVIEQATSGLYLDCDCGYTFISDGRNCFELKPGQKGIIWEKHHIAGTEKELDGRQSQKIIESRLLRY